MMLYIGNAGLARGYPLGAEILLMTLTAAVVGRFDHIPTVVLTSIGLGILNASLRYEWPDPSQRDFRYRDRRDRRGARGPPGAWHPAPAS